MATQSELYVAAQNGAVALALRDLHRLWSSLDLANGEVVRDALGLVWVDLIGTYGDVTATLAADRFEELTGKPATMVRPVDPDRANARMRWALGPLFGDDGDALARLDLLTDELVKQPGRSTIIRSSADQGIRYARVPTGAETCSFCLMLASRGASFLSAESAGTVSGKSLGGTDYRKLRELGDTAELRAEILAGRKTRASMKAAAGSKFHGNCVIEGSMVSGPRAVAATSRMYEGKIVTLTAGGHDLSVTPNHPILTGRGWVAAEFVNEFDHLFVTQFVGGVVAGGPDVYDGPARVEERFIALAMEGDTTRRRVPGAPKQFHGDGGDSEVDVVTTNHLFGDERNASSLEVDAEANLPFGAGVCAGHRRALSALGGAQDAFRTPGATESGSIGGRSLGLALRWGHLASASLARLAHPANMHTSRVEPPTDNSAGDAQITPEGVLTFPGQVSAHEVARSLDAVATSTPVDSVRAGYYVGHVYNLSTAPHWYAAESIVTHNCDCRVEPVTSQDDADRLATEGYDPDALYARWQEALAAEKPT